MSEQGGVRQRDEDDRVLAEQLAELALLDWARFQAVSDMIVREVREARAAAAIVKTSHDDR